MVASPVLTQVMEYLRRLYEAAITAGQIKRPKEFRVTSLPAPDERGSQGWRNYYVADDSGQPLTSIGSIEAKPTICD